MRLLGAPSGPSIAGVNELPGRTNYFRGSDPKRWQTSIPNFAKVRYQDVFDGIDLVYYGNQGQLEYDFVVSAGANADAIHLAFNGARDMHIDMRSGDLVLKVGKGTNEIRFRKPVAYQEERQSRADSTRATSKRLISADYVVDSHNRVRFQLGSYDHSKTLLIDPTLAYSTYLGGSSTDYGTGIAVDNTAAPTSRGTRTRPTFPLPVAVFKPHAAEAAVELRWMHS